MKINNGTFHLTQNTAHLGEVRRLLVSEHWRAQARLSRPRAHSEHHVQLQPRRLDQAGQDVRGGGRGRARAQPELPARHGRARHGPGVRSARRACARHLLVGSRNRAHPVLRQAHTQRHQHTRDRQGGQGGPRRRLHGHKHGQRPHGSSTR